MVAALVDRPLALTRQAALAPPSPPCFQVDKIRRLKGMCLEKGCNPWIEVDGGVTPDNAWKVRCRARSSPQGPVPVLLSALVWRQVSQACRRAECWAAQRRRAHAAVPALAPPGSARASSLKPVRASH